MNIINNILFNISKEKESGVYKYIFKFVNKYYMM